MTTPQTTRPIGRQDRPTLRFHSPETQFARLRAELPNLRDPDFSLVRDHPLPEWADGWLVLPHYRLAGISYRSACDHQLKRLAHERPLDRSGWRLDAFRDGRPGWHDEGTRRGYSRLHGAQRRNVLIMALRLRPIGPFEREPDTRPFGLGLFGLLTFLWLHAERLGPLTGRRLDASGNDTLPRTYALPDETGIRLRTYWPMDRPSDADEPGGWLTPRVYPLP